MWMVREFLKKELKKKPLYGYGKIKFEFGDIEMPLVLLIFDL